MRVLINSVLLENIGSQRDISYIFENFGWERALSYKAHQLHEYPRVFAYQHCPIGDNYLHFYCDQDIPGLYLPDKTLSIGRAFKNKLISMGWGEEKIEMTIGFRYQYLKRFIGDANHRKPSLLVLFSIDRRESQLFFRILRKTFLVSKEMSMESSSELILFFPRKPSWDPSQKIGKRSIRFLYLSCLER